MARRLFWLLLGCALGNQGQRDGELPASHPLPTAVPTALAFKGVPLLFQESSIIPSAAPQRKSVLDGTVVNAANEPLSGVEITLNGVTRATTDSSGHFRVETDVHAFHLGAKSSAVEGSIELYLESGEDLHGLIVTAAPKAAEPDENTVVQPREIPIRISGGNGETCLYASNHNISCLPSHSSDSTWSCDSNVRLYALDDGDNVSEVIDLDCDHPPDQLSFHLEPSGAIEGTVSSIRPGTSVELTNRWAGLAEMCDVDEIGVFHFSVLPPGAYRLIVDGADEVQVNVGHTLAYVPTIVVQNDAGD